MAVHVELFTLPLFEEYVNTHFEYEQEMEFIIMKLKKIAVSSDF